MSETELLQAFRENRSEEAFGQLVRRYAGLVYVTAKRRLANAALAEDITQMVFIRFAKNPPAVQTPAELAGWLHRTTLHVTIDMWRSETRRRNREQQALVMEPATSENAVWEEISPNLDEALNQLSDDDRQALLLRFFGQKTMREVGSALGVSEDAAKMRVGRAVERLRTQLGARSAACTAAVLATVLADRAVEAVPGSLLAKLAAIKLPVAGVAAAGGWLGMIWRMSKFQLVTGAAVLATIGFSVVHLVETPKAPAAKNVVTETNQTSAPRPGPIADGELDPPSANTFNPPMAATEKPVKMWFHVVDAETGYGLADTKIHVAYFGAGGQGEGGEQVTDNTGTAAIPEPDDATKSRGMNVFVVAEGHVPMAVNFHGHGDVTNYTIKLDPAMTVGGLVVDAEGAPVGGVKIMIQGPGNKAGQMENVDFQTCPVTNNADGSWSCSYLPKDFTNEIRFVLKKPGYAVTTPEVPVNRVDLNNLVLVIDRGFAILGRIADQQGEAVTNARIRIINGSSVLRMSAKTDDAGVYTMSGVSGNYDSLIGPVLETNANGVVVIHGLAGKGKVNAELVVQADGFAAQRRTVELPDPTNTVNFTLSPGNVFRGRVVDEAGNPMSNVVVQTDYDFEHQIEKHFGWTTYTDADGRFEWDSAPAEGVCYWFEADGYKIIRGEPYVADGSEHEITLKHAARK